MRADNFQTAVRFGPYEANFRVGELRKNGIRIRIQSKPLAVLAVLVEKAGEVVSREQLREALWDDGTFVDFDKNLSTAVNKLRGGLSDSPKRPRYIETVPRRGYRFLAQVENEVASQPTPSITSERRASGEEVRYVETATERDYRLAMPVKFQPKDSGGLHKPSPTGTRRTKVIDSLAVLPFVNASADAEAEFLSDGITETLINSLSQIPKLRVIPRTMAFRYKGVEIDPQRAGHELQVRAVLTGRVQQRGETLVIQTELVDICNEAQLWGGQYRRKLSDLLTVQEDISEEISQKLRLQLTHLEKKRLSKRYPRDIKAYQLYLKGRYFWNKRTEEGLRKAIECFQKAIAKDTEYASAYAGLADSYLLTVEYGLLLGTEGFPRAKAAALKALALDDSIPEVHTSLASVRENYEWDWLGAERGYKRAIELDPHYVTARQWYAELLVENRRFEEAYQEIEHARELDPLSPIINLIAGEILYESRRYDEAIEQLLQTLELDQNFALAHRLLGEVYKQKGNDVEAVAELERAVALSSPGMMMLALGSLGHAHAVAGRKEAADAILQQLQELSKNKYVSPIYLALIYAGLGHKDEAFQWLEKAYDERATWLVFFKVEPCWDSLRSDPRFDDLLRRMKLPP